MKPDPDALEAWEQMPKSKPSKDALPPAMGGMPKWLWVFIGSALAIGIITVIIQSL